MTDSTPPESPAELTEIIGFHIRLAHGAVYRHFSETFSDLGLTQKQVSVLWLIDANPGVAQTELAATLQMDRATTMEIVNRLEKRGLLVRGRSKEDGRKQTLDLTDEGISMLGEARQAIATHEEWLKARFTEKEQATLIELLSRIHSGGIIQTDLPV